MTSPLIKDGRADPPKVLCAVCEWWEAGTACTHYACPGRSLPRRKP